MAVHQHVRASRPRPPADEAAYADAALSRTAHGPAARTPIVSRPAGDPHDALAIDRWNNEGGRILDGRQIGNGGAGAPGATRRPGSLRLVPRSAARLRVMVAGAGVAGLETVLALRALTADRLDISLLAPEAAFADRPAAVRNAFAPSHRRAPRLATIARNLGVRRHQASLGRVEPARHRVMTTEGDELPYDVLVLAVGARAVRSRQSEGVLTLGSEHDAARAGCAEVLHALRRRQSRRLAFVKPPGASWATPLYDLALLTAAYCALHEVEVELTFVTPESQPLAAFGTAASTILRQLLGESAVALHPSSHGVPHGRGWLDISPGGHRMRADNIVTQPRLLGPWVRGIPADRAGFIQTEPSGRVVGIDDVYGAGDATTGAIKHGGLAARQADAIAAQIAFAADIIELPARADSLELPYVPPCVPPCESSAALPDDRHAIDILLEHARVGRWRTCLDLLDLPAAART